MGIELINVSECFQTGGKPAEQMAHKWSQAGAMGPTDTNYYWQLADGEITVQFKGDLRPILAQFILLK